MALALASEEANHWTWEIATLGTDFQCVFWAHGGLSKSYHAFKSYFFKINLHMSIGISTTSLSLHIYIYFIVFRWQIWNSNIPKKSNLLLISNYVYIYTHNFAHLGIEICISSNWQKTRNLAWNSIFCGPWVGFSFSITQLGWEKPMGFGHLGNDVLKKKPSSEGRKKPP